MTTRPPHQSEGLSDDPLLRRLLALHEGLRQAIGSKWNRSLPFADQSTGQMADYRHMRILNRGEQTFVDLLGRLFQSVMQNRDHPIGLGENIVG